MRYGYTDKRDGKILRAKFALPLLLAAMTAALALWLASPAPPVAQAAAASCGGSANPLHGRSEEVVDAILGRLSETDCSAVTATQLAGITGTLDLSLQSINTLRNGDFDDLTSLQTINLRSNSLGSRLHSDLFDGLTSLEELSLQDNLLQAEDLPEDLFDGLTSLQTLNLSDNVVASLPADMFDGLTSLESLDLDQNSLTSLPADLFDGLTSLENLDLDDNSLTSLPADLFDGLTKLERLDLRENPLPTLPSDVFDGLSNLENLFLNDNPLVWLPPDLFAGLSSLQQLRLNSNDSDFTPAQSLACIHAGQFDGLGELQQLQLKSHQLGNISPAHFARWNLGKLEELQLGGDTPGNVTFAAYQSELPALVEANFQVASGGLTDPICGSVGLDDGTGVVRVLLEIDSVRPNRARVSDAALLGDGHCGSDATATRHQLWTWERSDDGVTWRDMASGRQPKDYGTRGAGECSFLYTPQTDDNGKYVRAYVPVTTTGLGENDYHSAPLGPLDVP